MEGRKLGLFIAGGNGLRKEKCPAFSICPLKGVLGDQPKSGEAPAAPSAKPGSKKKG